MMMESTFQAALDDALRVVAFGKTIEDLTIAPSKESSFAKAHSTEKLTFAWIHGARIDGSCVNFPKPILLLLPGDGAKPTGCSEFTAEKGFLMWNIPKEGPVALLTHDVGPAGEIIKLAATRGLETTSDFRIYDVRLDGTVVRGKVRAYLRFKLPGPFHTTIFDITVIDRDDAFSIDLAPGLCIPVFSIGVATAQVCFHNHPNRICGEVVVGIDLPVVGHYGKTFTLACVNV
jgi:hypothetical protein